MSKFTYAVDFAGDGSGYYALSEARYVYSSKYQDLSMFSNKISSYGAYHYRLIMHLAVF